MASFSTYLVVKNKETYIQYDKPKHCSGINKSTYYINSRETDTLNKRRNDQSYSIQYVLHYYNSINIKILLHKLNLIDV